MTASRQVAGVGTRGAWARPFAVLVAQIEAEQDRWFLWVPVLFGAGIALYFALPFEPRLGVVMALAAAALVLAVVWREGGLAVVVTTAVLAFTTGLATATWRTAGVAAPVVPRQIGPVGVSGWVELVEPRPGRGQRLTVRVAAMERTPPAARPTRVRVRTVEADADLKPGDAIRFRAMLSPPAPPALPGGYDFARSAWFMRLGAVGYTRDRPARAEVAAPVPGDLVWRAVIERVRQAIGARITAGLAGETGAIANALITGERGAISDATNDAYRAAGLFHILSISGLHMVIMAGAVLVAVRFLLAAIPWLALHYPIKKWAAVAALLGALAYLLISGASFATVRSYIMISIMLMAVLLDRPAVALRNVALSALVILVVWPESLIDAGFQMSYAAVTALVAVYERVHEREAATRDRRGPVLQTLLFFGGIIGTTLVASIAVAPFGAYHFHNSQQYAALANLVAIPICNIVVMPAALAVLVAMPLGLEAWPLVVMGLGIDAMTWVARGVAALPGAVTRIPEIPTLAFGLTIAGGLWLCLWRRRWRWLGLMPVAVGLAVAPLREAPDVLVGRGGHLVAVRGADGRLAAHGDRGGAFDLARWLEHDGDGARPETAIGRAGFVCDAVGCTARVRGRHLAVAERPAALPDDCARAHVLVLPMPRPNGCAGRETVLDAPRLARDGAVALSIDADRVRLRTVRGERGTRPWTGGAQGSASIASGSGAGAPSAAVPASGPTPIEAAPEPRRDDDP